MCSRGTNPLKFVPCFHLQTDGGQLTQVCSNGAHLTPDLPWGLQFHNGVISGTPRMRSDPLIYTVVVEDAYSAWENYTQSISLSVFCTHFIYSSPIAKYCPTEGEWEQTWDKDSVSLTCSFGLGHRIRTCNGTEWMEEQSDCNAVLVFLSTSLAGILIVLVLFIVLCIRCRHRRQSKEDKEEGIEIPPLPANPKPATALSQTPEEAPSTSVETSSTPEAAVNGVNALEGAEGTEGGGGARAAGVDDGRRPVFHGPERR